MNKKEFKFWKNISFLLSFILIISIICVINVGEASAASGDFVKVGLRYGGNTTSASVTTSGGIQVGSTSGKSFSGGSVISEESSVTLTISGDQVVISDTQGNTLGTMAGDGSQAIMASSGTSKVTFNGAEYRGGIIPYIGSSGCLNVINYLGLEDYLKGVIHFEMSQSNPAEALKAQSVTARSYVIANGGKHKSQGFDVCSTTDCQVYKGTSGEYSSTNAAVDSTAGQCIYYNGKVVSAFYFANSGGYTENSEDVWSSKIPYLRSVKDEFSPPRPWTLEMTAEEIKSALSSAGHNIGDVTSMAITAVNDSGYVAKLTITGTEGSVTLEKDRIRTVLGATKIRSRLFTIQGKGTLPPSTDPKIEDPSGIIDGDKNDASYFVTNGANTVKMTAPASVTNGTTQVNNVDPFTMYISNGNSVQSISGIVIQAYTWAKQLAENIATEAPLAASDQFPSIDTNLVTLENTGESTSPVAALSNDPLTTTTTYAAKDGVYIFTGDGYGHGVGMPQNSATQMAKQGYNYKDILKKYYTGIEVK